MDMIQQSVKYFLYCYDKAASLTESSAQNVVRVANEDVIRYSEELWEQNRRTGK